MTDYDDLNDLILDAARDVVVRYGYDKTTMRDIADRANVAKSTIYLRWNKKDELFESLLWRELSLYMDNWLQRLADDPQPTFSSVLRSALEAITTSDFIEAMYKRDRKLLGALVNRMDTRALYAQSHQMFTDFLTELQSVGAARDDIDPSAVAYLIECLEYGYIQMGDILPDDQSPSMETLLDHYVQMIERMVVDDTVDPSRGSAVVRDFIDQIRQLFDQMKQQAQTN